MPLPRLSCNRCGHSWVPRKEDLPGTCPKCKSPYWNKERVVGVPVKIPSEKQCTKCGEIKPISEFGKQPTRKTPYTSWCEDCLCKAARERRLKNLDREKAHHKAWYAAHKEYDNSRSRRWRQAHPGWRTMRNHLKGICKPMDKNKDCSLYFGVILAEKLVQSVFKDVEHMPTHTRGYDLLCGNGYRIDVKGACLYTPKKGPKCWPFDIKRNKQADYFACLAFDNRSDLNILHFWLIPGDKVNHLTGIRISSTVAGLKKWSEYERPLP